MKNVKTNLCDKCGIEFCNAKLKQKMIKGKKEVWCNVCRNEYKEEKKKAYVVEQEKVEKYLKDLFDAGMKAWEIEVPPMPCHLCGNPHLYLGHAHAMAMNVHCMNCGLKLEVGYDVYKCPSNTKELYATKNDKMMFGYNRWLLEEAIYKWNNKGKERAKRIDHSKDKD